MAVITILHFKNENQEYHHKRIERKEKSLQTHIKIIFSEDEEVNSAERAKLKIKKKLEELSAVHKLTINLYNIDGGFYASSINAEGNDHERLNKKIIKQLKEKSFFINALKSDRFLGQTNLLSYSKIKYKKDDILILYLPYTQENTIFKSELEDLLISFGELYIFILLGAIISAFFVSRYITQSLKKIGYKLNKTDLGKNIPFVWKSNDEIGNLVQAYNGMVVKLEESAILLAKSEREQAWREMAKQVAHEIKNPLTPMRLEVQLLERNAHKMESTVDKTKILDFSKGMILQIDTLSRIANAFSNFAKMPAQQLQTVDFSKFAFDFSALYSHNSIMFDIVDESMPVFIDEKQFSRVLNNLIKNAEQSIPSGRVGKIIIRVFKQEDTVNVEISDNGIGISDSEMTKIFEPKFTTKNGGMGLGLGIVRNIIESLGGKISFESEINIGTTFYIYIPIIKNN